MAGHAGSDDPLESERRVADGLDLPGANPREELLQLGSASHPRASVEPAHDEGRDPTGRRRSYAVEYHDLAGRLGYPLKLLDSAGRSVVGQVVEQPEAPRAVEDAGPKWQCGSVRHNAGALGARHEPLHRRAKAVHADRLDSQRLEMRPRSTADVDNTAADQAMLGPAQESALQCRPGSRREHGLRGPVQGRRAGRHRSAGLALRPLDDAV